MKTEFTQKERNQIYKQVFVSFSFCKGYGLCELIAWAAYGDYRFFRFVNEITFPELLLFKDSDRLYWIRDGIENAWSDEAVEIRKTVLEFCIAMTE